MNNQSEFEKFQNLKFDDFKDLASDDTLSIYQKIGFPDNYRKEKEKDIFNDIFQKLGIENNNENKVLLDIGPGCSELPLMIINAFTNNNAKILLADSEEMLNYLPDAANIFKFKGYFPDEMPALFAVYKKKVDYIIAYSVLHYVFYNTSVFKFIDSALSLLKSGGKFLIGDIPNISKRKRFFSSEAGIQFHKNFTGTDTMPEITNTHQEQTQIDDAVINSILQRYRNLGYEVYLLPQNEKLPMHNRREDLLICKY